MFIFQLKAFNKYINNDIPIDEMTDAGSRSHFAFWLMIPYCYICFYGKYGPTIYNIDKKL